MANRVPPEGSRSARIVIIGEAPGANENAARRPFVGATGSTLTRWWKSVGLQRSDFYLDNVVPYQPVRNDISTVSAEDMTRYTEELHERLSLLHDPWLIVPMGNTALQAITGKTGILKHRGSIYAYYGRAGNGGERGTGESGVKVIPTVHPAATFRDRSLTRRCLRDWQRIASDAQFRELRLPQREHYIGPDIDDLRAYIEDCNRDAQTLAIDIETPGGQLECIGFSYDPAFSITIPTTEKYWAGQLDEVMSLIQQLLACHIPKVMQNGLFDSYYLAWYGLTVSNWQWDTLAMHHAICPNDSHDLAYMASVDTREPYWKDEAKDPQEMKKYTSNQQAFWTYNGKDVAVTQELQGIYYGRLSESNGAGHVDDTESERGRLPFYRRHYRDMFEPLLRMSLGGIRLDDERRQIRYELLGDGCKEILGKLAELAGEPLHAKTGLSPIKLKKFLYQTLGLPSQRKRGSTTITTDETAIRNLMRRFPLFEEIGRLILDFRRKSKLAQFMADGIADEDRRVRCQYRFTTETGRLSSSSNPRGTGTNLQNQDHECLDMYIANEGQVLMGLDLSQAEDRWVKVIAYANRGLSSSVAELHRKAILSIDEAWDMASTQGKRQELDKKREWHDKMIHAVQECDWEEVLWRARAMPWENDEHWRAAEAIYGLPREQMDKGIHRQRGKKTRHALNYDMHESRYVDELSKEDVYIFVDEARRIMDALLVADPYIEVYQMSRRREVMQHRELENTWGREYWFDTDMLDDEAYRRAYAFQPQAEVADATNQWGIIAGHRYIVMGQLKSRLLAQKHDEALFSVDPKEAWELYQFVSQSLQQPRVYRGIELRVPADVFLGHNWKDKVEFKMPPCREEFEAAIEGLL